MRQRAVFFGLLILCLSCGSEKKNDPEGGEGADSNGNPPVGQVDETGFYIRTIKEDRIEFPIHKGLSTFSEPCVATAGQQIDCYVEGQENDLYFHGLELQYNVPSELCEYLRVMPYAYWKYRPGTGPTTLRIDVIDGLQGIDANNDGDFADPGDSGSVDTTCQFDYSPEQGPNCCTGTYTLTTRTWDATNSVYTSTVQADLQWGGKAASCLAGPAMDTQALSKDGYPLAKMYFVSSEGKNDTYKIQAPITKQLFGNIHVANYFDPANHGGTAPTATYRPYHDYQCLDRAHELIAQIRIQIREWDTDVAYNARVTAPTGHSVAGNEVWPISGFPLNDYFDWGNFGNTYPQGAD